ncbi:DNA methyltransferase [Cystobacter fuscus]
MLDRLKAEELPNYLERNRTQLEPSSVYRAKIWGRLEAKQRDFVDIGLLPILEEEMGKRITQLIERVVGVARESLGWTEPTERQGQWLLQSVFWILAAKILQDKEVERFRRLNLEDFDTVFERLSVHYNSGHPQPTQLGQQRRDALERAAGEIKRFANLRLLSTEALGYLYESALIDDATRQSLGTHTTPSWLVDYILGKLRPLIESIDVADRRVFEPACGHAAFLIAALRLLSELRPLAYSEDRRTYLRKRLRGVEVDSFAVDIAKLSLTLADVPNPNGWALYEGDMFKANILERETANASIVLSIRLSRSSLRPNIAVGGNTAKQRRRFAAY